MKKDLVPSSKVKLPTNWTYETEVETGKTLLASWNKKTIELARFLYKANLVLSNSGYRSDVAKISDSRLETTTLSQNETRLEPRTFLDFCEEIGLPRPTAYRWLATYDPDEDRLLTSDEVKERANSVMDALFREVHMMRVEGNPDYRPEKWTPSMEQKYQLWLLRNGYQTLPSNSIIPASLEPEVDKFGQFGLFGRDYLDSLGARCWRDTSGENGPAFLNMVNKYKNVVPKGIPTSQVVRIPILVKAALEDLPQEARKEVAILVAQIIAEQSEEM